MDPEEYRNLINEHGGIVGGEPLDPYVTDDVGVKRPNMHPKYRVTFRDGTYVVVRPRVTNDADPDASGNRWEVVDAGTAITRDKTPIGELEPMIDPRTGKQYAWRDPKTGAISNLPALRSEEAGELELLLDPRTGEPYAQRNTRTGTISNLPALPRGSGGGSYSPSAQQRADTEAEKFGFERDVKWPYQVGRDESADALTLAKHEFDKQKWAEQQQAATEKMAWDKLAKEQEFDQAMRRQKMASATDWAGNMLTSRVQAAPYALGPGQTHYRGFEPGGIMQSIAQMSGRWYDPDKYKVAVVDYDPREIWQQAWAQLQQELAKQG